MAEKKIAVQDYAVEHFQPLVGQKIRFQPPAVEGQSVPDPIDLELLEASPVPKSYVHLKREPFSLLFFGNPPTGPLSGSYTILNDQFEESPLYMTPVTVLSEKPRGEDGFFFEVILS